MCQLTRRLHGRAMSGGLLLLASAAALVLAAPASASSHSVTPVSLEKPAIVAQYAGGASYVQSVRAYWTPARMARAIPYEVTAPGDIGLSPYGSLAKVTLPFTRTEIKNTTAPGIRTNGKIFFLRGGDEYVCSGTAVTSATKAEVITAGHCLTEKGVSASKMIFVPGYRNETAPFGVFVVTAAWTIRAWMYQNDFRYDLSALLVSRNEGGQKLQNAVGARQPRFNKSRNQLFNAYGYPQKKPFNGEKLYRCTSRKGKDGKELGQPWMMGIGCDMTPGSSGGGWLIQNRYLNGVNSYQYKYKWPNVMFSPYFGPAAQGLYRAVR